MVLQVDKDVRRFLAVSSGSGSGYGDGDGDGYGSGYGYGYGSGYGYGDGDGYGSGDGYGYGDGDGYGYGSGDGYGYGSGDGYGDGDGYGSGDGYGYGSGDGYGIKMIDGQNVYMVDNVATIITSIHRNYAKGFLLEKDLTLKPCYIAKCGDYFAHGDTLRDAVRDAKAKYDENRTLDERIDDFVKEFPTLDTVANCKNFYEWHHVLTGSCDMGRREFCKSHGIDMDKDYTVRYFLDITKDDFGKDAIRRLRERYE